ncbi:ATP-binding protein [Tropicimonas sp. IMCC6043]|uniref:ATP-binding protein n=1 Tax=Tropicimonas sp. IMCC6043 TaxID=2510645 RepID=UPI00101B6DD2|nr:ATP-binding protein [Tropicimonas sp. IMCC6043]RYH07768.1 ATP-binding protein [Tropicimonas sp. IMCC6043]
MSKLSDIVTVSRRFQRSVRLDTDHAIEGALQGYVCHGSSRQAMDTMARLFQETGQRAFTWTGPYGGGKSSLALLLCQTLGGSAQQNQAGLQLLGDMPGFHDAFPQEAEPWLVVPLVGRRANPVADLREALADAVAREDKPSRTKRRQIDPAGRDVIERLVKEASARPEAGVLLVIDELGKYLEAAADGDADIHFFQELAEAAARCHGRLLVVGVLHQSFDQYARRFGSEMQEDWAKIQGRFVDIPIVTAIDEVLDLVGRALARTDEAPIPTDIIETVAGAIRRRRPGSPSDLAVRLAACWPLHPVTASLIGPLSRRRFGQNERSVFGFLNSAEPGGFQEYLKTHQAGTALYDPAQLWDYLKANLEPAILASPDSHRWSQAIEALQRCERKGTPLHLKLAKSIAVIELFNGGSGVVPERSILASCLPEATADKLDQALQQLQDWSVAVFRGHLDAFALFAGSDFDIEDALSEAQTQMGELNLNRLSAFADLQPVLAKKHYFTTGTLRWFTTALASPQGLTKLVEAYRPSDGAAGQFLLVIPDEDVPSTQLAQRCREASSQAGAYPVALGVPPNAQQIREAGSSLLALESIRQGHTALEGDAVARREVEARLAVVSTELEDALRQGFVEATWYVRGAGHEAGSSQAIAQIASTLAETTFPKTPHIRSELVNREQPSSNSQAAVRALLHAMVNHTGENNLGIEGFPAEMGLYRTVLKASGLHRQYKGTFDFRAPTKTMGPSLIPMWEEAKNLAQSKDGEFPLLDLYGLWKEPPFGVRSGLLPLLAATFILAYRSSMAVYVEDIFQPEINDYVIDRLLQDPRNLSLRHVDPKTDGKELLKALSAEMECVMSRAPEPKPLDIAQALVEFVMRLPEWTRRTQSLSKPAQELCRILRAASDPHRTLFVDLVQLSGRDTPAAVAGEIGGLLRELNQAYETMLIRLRDKMLDALGHSERPFEELQRRAETIKGISGDLRLDAFASRLQGFSGSLADMESLAGLLANKPPRNWSDLEPSRAAMEAGQLALAFRQAEMLAQVQGRDPSRHALGVVVGTGEHGTTALRAVELSAKEQDAAKALAASLQDILAKAGVSDAVALAALAEAGMQRISDHDDEMRSEAV